jgi:hypothetical protein
MGETGETDIANGLGPAWSDTSASAPNPCLTPAKINLAIT